MKRIAIIPARGGSKRIPRKNIKLFHGKPIIAYPILKALESDLFDRVIVSTDDLEIAEIAREFGAEVPFMRSSENASDFATTVDVILEVLNQLNDESISEVCCIYPTSPLLNVETLVVGFKVLNEQRFDSVISACKYSTPVQRSLIVNNGKMKFANPEYTNTRSQDLEEHYFDAGQCYWFYSKTVLESKKLFTSNTGFVELSAMQTQDIDNLDDWKMAVLKYQLLNP